MKSIVEINKDTGGNTMNEIVEVKIETVEGLNVVSSRDIAEGLGKQHKNVLRDLDKVIEFGGSDLSHEIIPSTYINSRGKEYREYLLTKDGFTLYMFNIQGYNDFKIAYINKFNEMEKELQNRNSIDNVKASLLLSIYNGGQEGITASKQLVELETAPLLETIEEQQPKVEYCDEVLSSSNTCNVTQIAQDYGMSARKLNGILNDLGIQYKSNNQWILYSKYKDKGYIKSITDTNKYGHTYINTKWTQKGRKFLYEKLKSVGYCPINDNNLI